jgi:hypothetical protein
MYVAIGDEWFICASQHPSFRDAVHNVMNKMVVKAIADGNRYDVQRFVWWAENQSAEDRSSLTNENLNKAYGLLPPK